MLFLALFSPKKGEIQSPKKIQRPESQERLGPKTMQRLEPHKGGVPIPKKISHSEFQMILPQLTILLLACDVSL